MRTSDSLRKTYGETLVELGEKNTDIVMLEADLGNSTMSSLFGNMYPERYFQMGIAEQNMASVAAGLSLTGKIPFINSFAVFASGRAYDQIRSFRLRRRQDAPEHRRHRPDAGAAAHDRAISL